MKIFIVILLLLFPLSVFAENGWQEARLPTTIIGGSVPVAAAGPDIFDDFNRGDNDNPGANWTEASGDWDISSNTLIEVTQSATTYAIYSGTALSTADQYAKVKFTTFQESNYDYIGLVFRYTATDSPFYTISHSAQENLLRWCRRANLAGGCTEVQSTSMTLSQGDTFAVTLAGTGTDTVFRVWINASGTYPDSATSWGGDTSPDYTFSNDPASPVNSGAYVGLMAYVYSNPVAFDDFSAGDIP